MSSSPTFAVVNARVIDGTGNEPISAGVVVFSGGRIISIGPMGDVGIPRGAQTYDVRGATVLPGVINTHVHTAYTADNLARWTTSGVTTVRDMGTDWATLPASMAFRGEASSNPALARVVSAGSLVTIPGGYQAGGGATVSSPDEARRVVDQEVDSGVEFIKLTLQRPAAGPDQGLSRDQACAAVEEAHDRGARVTAHVVTTGDLAVALDCGVDDIAHMVGDDLPGDVIDRLVASGTILEPTLTNWEAAAERRAVEGNLGRFVADGGVVALGCEYIASERADGPFVGMPLAELQMMRRAGMSPMQVIVAATRNAAAAIGMSADLGTLEPGKIADIIVVDGDPLADVGALGRVTMVVHGGAVIKP